MRKYVMFAGIVGFVGCQFVALPNDALFLCESDNSCQANHTCIDTLCHPNDKIGKDASVADASLGLDSSVPSDASEPLDASSEPDAGLADSSVPADASDPGLDAAEPGLDSSVPSDASEPGLDASEPGPDASEPGLDASEPGPDASVVPDAGPPFPAQLTMVDPGQIGLPLKNGSNSALVCKFVCVGGTCSFPRFTVSYVFTGSGSVGTIDVYRNGTWISGGASQAVHLYNVATGKTAVVFPIEEQVVAGTDHTYLIETMVSGVVSGSRLKVCIPKDTLAQIGFLYNTTGSSLYATSSGLCSEETPYFPWSGVAHTAPSPECSISSFGTPDYATSAYIEGDEVCNELVVP